MSTKCLRITNFTRYICKHRCSPISKKFFGNLPQMSGNQAENTTDNQGIRLKDAVTILKQFADLDLAEKWDNVGLLIEPATCPLIKNVLLTNDLTENVMKEAIDKEINLVISYHPPIFQALKRVAGDNWKERIVASCLENRIAVYSPHTSWDAVHGGVTDWFAEAFFPQLRTEVQPLIPNLNQELYPKCGGGRLIPIHKTTIKTCVEMIKIHTGLNNLRIATANNKNMESLVHTVAVVCGSGGSFLPDVKADLFVTGEMSHHEVLEAIHNGITVILTNHSDSERGFLSRFSVKLQELYKGNVKVFISEHDRDPLFYV